MVIKFNIDDSLGEVSKKAMFRSLERRNRLSGHSGDEVPGATTVHAGWRDLTTDRRDAGDLRGGCAAEPELGGSDCGRKGFLAGSPLPLEFGILRSTCSGQDQDPRSKSDDADGQAILRSALVQGIRN